MSTMVSGDRRTETIISLIVVVVFCVSVPYSVVGVYKRFESRAVSIFRVEVLGQEDVSAPFLPPHADSCFLMV